jgi:2-polyprenyl-3-methyl-5-hydroxy-6-metoxy-1,4-benzoquinol methylase
MVKNPHDMEITYFHDEVKQLEGHFSLQRKQRILVVGCGFGYLVEAMMDLKFQNCWGMDNSTWIAANRATEARSDVPILEIGILDEGLLPRLAARTGSAMFDWVVDEHILEGYLDEQHKPLIMAMNELVPDPARVIHMIQPISEGKTGDPSMNWKTFDEWVSVYEHNRWIAPGRNEVR